MTVNVSHAEDTNEVSIMNKYYTKLERDKRLELLAERTATECCKGVRIPGGRLNG